MQDTFSEEYIEKLRKRHYNATVSRLRLIHDELMVINIQPDDPLPEFQGGQYTIVGLGNWEPRSPDTQVEHLSESEREKLVKRAYSISCSLLNGENLQTAGERGYLEFYIALVRVADKKPPALTPRLFQLQEGARLYLGPKITGHYTLEAVQDDDDVLFLATGTGEAPHNAMLAELLSRGHRGRILSAVCVRYRSDLAYLETHQKLTEQFANYSYCPMTTREPENVDTSHPNFVGKEYLQEFISSGKLEGTLGYDLDPARTHVYLCGNPAMIGIPTVEEGRKVYPETTGVIELLEGRGFAADQTGQPGNIHFEKYW